MEASYLRSTVGPVLSKAFAALYTVGLDSHEDPTHPHKDPVSFLGRYLLDHDETVKELAIATQIQNNLQQMQKVIQDKQRMYQEARNTAFNELKRVLEKREIEKENAALRQAAEEERIRLEAEAAEQKELDSQQVPADGSAPQQAEENAAANDQTNAGKEANDTNEEDPSSITQPAGDANSGDDAVRPSDDDAAGNEKPADAPDEGTEAPNDAE